jgi:hypothetical protein
VAHPVIAAGIAVVLVAGVQPQAVSSTPHEALSEQCDTLRLTWHPMSRTWIPASELTARTKAATAMFHIPAAARPLLHAARPFQPLCPRSPPCRAAARRNAVHQRADHGRSRQLRDSAARQQSLEILWQTRITCARAEFFGTRHDAGFAADQAFEPAACP